ncbi:hypothetical protein PGT21_019178 [Puccinia graminis f. sp. tritici]|uniref:Uncharacterized protein n=1 Tax=Puccinia graminis f. sp. tritici TaxID=56615 RepID=A0A5B0PAZ1_PUCGR|nr:hypothetical protein PGT21_019178 [Puccinia graminis f. sp. tritici]KAA1126007.1 hypothetical protein PGTUg99_010899 [Puccinia graminis f. sp. tritici]
MADTTQLPCFGPEAFHQPRRPATKMMRKERDSKLSNACRFSVQLALFSGVCVWQSSPDHPEGIPDNQLFNSARPPQLLTLCNWLHYLFHHYVQTTNQPRK